VAEDAEDTQIVRMALVDDSLAVDSGDPGYP
jgi:hypothetical protein